MFWSDAPVTCEHEERVERCDKGKETFTTVLCHRCYLKSRVTLFGITSQEEFVCTHTLIQWTDKFTLSCVDRVTQYVSSVWLRNVENTCSTQCSNGKNTSSSLMTHIRKLPFFFFVIIISLWKIFCSSKLLAASPVALFPWRLAPTWMRVRSQLPWFVVCEMIEQHSSLT